jgi:hypothetical protein
MLHVLLLFGIACDHILNDMTAAGARLLHRRVQSGRRADVSIINCGKSNSVHVALHVDKI